MNIRNLTYKQKNVLLLVGTVLFVIISYMLAFSRTIELAGSNRTLSGKIARAEKAPEEIIYLEKKVKFLNDRIDDYMVDSLKNQEYLLNVISKFCLQKEVTLREFPQTIEEDHRDIIIITNKFKVEGSYLELLELAYEIEQVHRIGRLSSMSFNTYMDHKRKRKVLTLTIFLQNIKFKSVLNEV